ncbi:hypothetical protein BLOT_013952 [Blomia tropicalis]|nr:hypothetical protein BLOT_013952 [Blomia tropicalis]
MNHFKKTCCVKSTKNSNEIVRLHNIIFVYMEQFVEHNIVGYDVTSKTLSILRRCRLFSRFMRLNCGFHTRIRIRKQNKKTNGRQHWIDPSILNDDLDDLLRRFFAKC